MRLIPNIELVSVCDSRADIAASIGREWDAAAFSDVQGLLKHGGVDLVMVLTPAATHRDIVCSVARAGFHVLCEKPLAISVSDAESMIEACNSADVKLFYGASYRYLPAIRRAKELIDSGAIGQIQLMSEQLIGGSGVENYRQLSPSHYPSGGPGGVGMGLVDHGIHLIDIFHWFVGAAPIVVSGVGQISGAPASTEFVIMRFPNGALGHLLYNAATFSATLPNEGMFSGGQGWLIDGAIADPGSWESEPGSIFVYGAHGSLRIFHYVNALFINAGGGPRRIELSGRAAFGHFATQLEDCISAIRNGSKPPVSGEDGMAALKTLLSVYAPQGSR
jgi:predicted dehydrogenase